MIVFLAGKMSGLPDYGYPKFRAAAERLRAEGHAVINPAENHGGRTDLPHGVYLLTTIRQIVGPPAVDAVAVLPCWRHSVGARLEVDVARAVGIPIVYAADLAVVDARLLVHR